MSNNVIHILSRQPITQNPRITSASLEWNRIMHLRAHGWKVIEEGSGYMCSKADENVWHPLAAAWQIQKLSELANRYWS